MITIRGFLSDPAYWTRETREIAASTNPDLNFSRSQICLRRVVRCADGFTMSVQYSPMHYCNARVPLMGGDWDGQGGMAKWPEPRSVEIGFPNRREPLLREYAEEWWRPAFRSWKYDYQSWRWKLAKLFQWVKIPNWTRTVYPWVPVDVAERIVAKHGWITHVRNDDFSTWERV